MGCHRGEDRLTAAAPAVVVTGVSTGVGRAVADALAQHGFTVFGSVRSPSDAAAFERAFGRGRALIFDVTDEPAVRAAAAAVREATGAAGLAGLVNNAGIAVVGPLEHLPLDRLRRQFEVNVTGVLCVTQAFLPLLLASAAGGRPGRIVNVSSVAGTLPMPFTGAYAASKAALDALSTTLRRELAPQGIFVSVVMPASVRTPIWDKGDAEDVSPYAATAYATALPVFKQAALAAGRAGLPAAAVGATVLAALTARRPRSRYLVAADRGLSYRIMRLLPDRLLDRLIGRRLGLAAPPGAASDKRPPPAPAGRKPPPAEEG